MAGRITYRNTELLRNDDVLIENAVLPEQLRADIEKLIKRALSEDEVTTVLKTIFRLSILKSTELSIRKSKKYVTSQDVQRTLKSFANLTPNEVFPAYQNSGKIIRSIIDQVSRMEMGINIHGGNDQLISSLGLSSNPEESVNALGSSIKKAAAIALEYYPYSPLNPRPNYLKRNGKPAIGQPIRRTGQPVKLYREKLASYSLELWAELGMEPCKAWQRDPYASEIVRFMLVLSVSINDYSLSPDLTEAVRLLKEAAEWVIYEHPQNEVS